MSPSRPTPGQPAASAVTTSHGGYRMDRAAVTIRTSRIDAEHIWHPYGGFPASPTPLVVTDARGVRLTLDDGRELIDGMSSWWAACHGYQHPVLDAALREQSEHMSHVMFGGLTHPAAAALTERLVAMTGLPRVFLADSGSVAIEVAAKLALQYQRATGHTSRTQLLTWRGGYHGDTLMPMSVCDPEGGMHSLWTGVVPKQLFMPAPPAAGGLNPASAEEVDAYCALVEHSVATHAATAAAVIVEPVVQGAGGMRFHEPRIVAALAAACRRHGVLLILDEIATGFGRTGTLFAAEAAGITPDILCLGKALTGGYLTLGATLTTREISETISAAHGGVMHGPTFMGNPLACAVADASCALIDAGGWRTDVPRIERGLIEGLASLAEESGVIDVRVRGAIGVVHLDHPVDIAAATRAAVAAGVWIRPFRDLIYVMPPYIISEDDLATVCAGVTAAVHAG